MKAAAPDLESQAVNTADFRNCGDDVPASFSIDREQCNIAANSIAKTSSLPRASVIGRIASKVTTHLQRVHHDANLIRETGPIENFAKGYRTAL